MSKKKICINKIFLLSSVLVVVIIFFVTLISSSNKINTSSQAAAINRPSYRLSNQADSQSNIQINYCDIKNNSNRPLNIWGEIKCRTKDCKIYTTRSRQNKEAETCRIPQDGSGIDPNNGYLEVYKPENTIPGVQFYEDALGMIEVRLYKKELNTLNRYEFNKKNSAKCISHVYPWNVFIINCLNTRVNNKLDNKTDTYDYKDDDKQCLQNLKYKPFTYDDDEGKQRIVNISCKNDTIEIGYTE